MPNPVSALNKIKNMFSPLERTIIAHKMETMPSSQWAAYIKANAPKAAKKEALAIKLDELLARQPKVSKADIVKHIQDNSPKISTKNIRAESFDGDETQYAKYVLPGGEDYTETLIHLPANTSSPSIRMLKSFELSDENGKLLGSGTVPMSPRMQEMVNNNPNWVVREFDQPHPADVRRDPSNFASGHFDEPNIVAHLRTNIKTTPDNKDVLFLEELQSDWAQQGRKKGFGSGVTIKPDANGFFRAYDNNGNAIELRVNGERFSALNTEEAVRAALPTSYVPKGIPHGPYVEDTGDWTALGLKKAIERAVDEGQSHLAWTTGAQQADRYNLAKQLDRVQATKYGDEWAIAGYNGNAETINHTVKSNEELANVVGKDLANKIIESNGGEFSGIDLQVGGEGMRTYYDQIVPSTANDILKSMGVTERVKPIGVQLGNNVSEQMGFEITPEIRDYVLNQGLPAFAGGGVVKAAAKGLREMAEQYITPKAAPAVNRIDMNYKDVTKRVPELTRAANMLETGEVTASEYDKLVNSLKPVAPYSFVPAPATYEDAMRALTKNKQPMYGKASEIPAGEQTDLRLDIPAYKDHGVWVNSIHRKDAPTVYDSVSSVKNATMIGAPDKALKVAKGGPKAPFAVIRGEWNPISQEEAVKKAQENIASGEWVQVGYDPERHGYFYDRSTMEPIAGAEEIIQIGPLVIAKNPAYAAKAEQKFAGGGVVKGAANLAKKYLTPLSEKEFYKTYVAQHKDIRNVTPEDRAAAAQAILESGFNKGVNVNALPVDRGGPARNVIDKRYGNKAGDRVYLLPKEGVLEGGNGLITAEGYKPTPMQVLDISVDREPSYEAYLRNFTKEYAGGGIVKAGLSPLAKLIAEKSAKIRAAGYSETPWFHGTNKEVILDERPIWLGDPNVASGYIGGGRRSKVERGLSGGKLYPFMVKQDPKLLDVNLAESTSDSKAEWLRQLGIDPEALMQYVEPRAKLDAEKYFAEQDFLKGDHLRPIWSRLGSVGVGSSRFQESLPNNIYEVLDRPHVISGMMEQWQDPTKTFIFQHPAWNFTVSKKGKPKYEKVPDETQPVLWAPNAAASLKSPFEFKQGGAVHMDEGGLNVRASGNYGRFDSENASGSHYKVNTDIDILNKYGFGVTKEGDVFKLPERTYTYEDGYTETVPARKFKQSNINDIRARYTTDEGVQYGVGRQPLAKGWSGYRFDPSSQSTIGVNVSPYYKGINYTKNFADGGKVSDPFANLSMMDKAKLLAKAAKYRIQYNKQAVEHGKYPDALSSELKKNYLDQVGNSRVNRSPLDAALNYGGGYDFGVRQDIPADVARDMGKAYQYTDYFFSPFTGPKSDAVGDYYENMAGVEAGIKERGRRATEAEIQRRSAEYGRGVSKMLPQYEEPEYAEGGAVETDDFDYDEMYEFKKDEPAFAEGGEVDYDAMYEFKDNTVGFAKGGPVLSVGRGEKLPVSKGAGLTAKGRAKYNAATGSNLKAPAPHPKTDADAGRRKSFCARMSGMPGPMKDEQGNPTRKAASLKRWNC